MLQLLRTAIEQSAATRELLRQTELREPPSAYYSRLLRFLIGLCDCVREELEEVQTKVVTNKPAKPGAEATVENLVALSSDVLSEIHNYCEYFDHAEQLAVPIPMIQLLNRLGVQTGQNKPFILRGMFAFNYMYYPLGIDLNRLAVSISSKIGTIDNNFSAFSFPLAYKDNILANCALIHEFGHLAVDAAGLIRSIISAEPKITKDVYQIVEMRASVNEQGEQLDFFTVMEHKDSINEVLSNWIHEVLADLIGMHLLGPAHLLSFIRYIMCSGSHHQDDAEHPCDSYRLRSMIEAAKRLGWEDIMKEASESWDRAQRISLLKREEGDFRYDTAAECLPILEPVMWGLASGFCGDATYKPETLSDCKEQALALLDRGIPPLEMLDSETNTFQQFDAISILNAGWLCYENGCPGWENQFMDLTPVRRLELLNRLLTKAVELSFVKEAEAVVGTRG